MAAPQYVPVPLPRKPRLGEAIPPARPWRATRPADLAHGQPVGLKLGRPGPDQGYALVLARRFDDRLQLAEGEHAEDVVAGCLGVALNRAALFGRAPVIHDLELAFTLWGFVGDAPADLVAFRKPLFSGAAHHYWEQRAIVDIVPDETVRLTPAEVRARLPEWRTLLGQ